jgi:hypothetical protein
VASRLPAFLDAGGDAAAQLGIIDADAFFMLMLATTGFVVLAHHLRREMPLSISDRWITFYALSYTYTMIALTTGASWLSFLGAVTARSRGWRWASCKIRGGGACSSSRRSC